MLKPIALIFSGFVTLILLGGCSSVGVGVKPWQREILSKPSMQLEGNVIDNAVDEHIYFSKEASSGGRGFGGGGCGCN